MQLYFIRHAQSTNNLLYEQVGYYADGRHEDPELTALGKKQIEIVAQFVAAGRGATPTTRDAWVQNIDGFGLTHVYSSLMVRAMDTADAIASALGLTPVARDDLHEVGGVWLKNPETGERVGLPGHSRAFFEQRYPQFELPAGLNGDGWWGRPLETMEECFVRATTLLADLQARHGDTDDRVAIVSHGMFYNVFLRALLGLPQQPGIWFAINNVAITRIDFEEKETRLAYHNRADFLPPELVT